jgi:hypothetical protein
MPTSAIKFKYFIDNELQKEASAPNLRLCAIMAHIKRQIGGRLQVSHIYPMRGHPDHRSSFSRLASRLLASGTRTVRSLVPEF